MKYLFLFVCLIFGTNAHCQIPGTSNEDISFEVIENVPLYKGCLESMSSDEKRQCMSDKISQLVSDNFNKLLLSQLGLPDGMQKIDVIFKINEAGIVTDIQAKASHPALEMEAIRVIRLIPDLRPGMQDGTPVAVPYRLPIAFNVKNDLAVEENKTFPVCRGCNKDLDFEALKQCTTERIMDFIKVSTIIDDADELFPTERSTEFEASFTIDKNGRIKDIGAKAYKRELGVLVIRALQQLPKMKLPGTINGQPVDVPFKFKMTLYFD